MTVHALRQAIKFAQKEFGIKRLLLSGDIRTDAGQIFLNRYGQLIDLSRSGQLAMRRLFEEHLKRVEWDDSQFPMKLYPFVSTDAPTVDRPIVIDARIAFGRPVVARRGISTAAIVERIDAGESVSDLATDYDLQGAEIEEAVVYERAA